MSDSIKPKLVLVTGANRGIDREVVRQLAERGYRVLLGARDFAKGVEAAGVIGRSVEAIALDVAHSASIDRALQDLTARFGGVDALVNNACIQYDNWEPPTNTDWAIIREAQEKVWVRNGQPRY
jgi:NAD(P)-dependent dehydrogenase (short-subunit alcohol dehydrogenase family)